MRVRQLSETYPRLWEIAAAALVIDPMAAVVQPDALRAAYLTVDKPQQKKYGPGTPAGGCGWGMRCTNGSEETFCFSLENPEYLTISAPCPAQEVVSGRLARHYSSLAYISYDSFPRAEAATPAQAASAQSAFEYLNCDGQCHSDCRTVLAPTCGAPGSAEEKARLGARLNAISRGPSTGTHCNCRRPACESIANFICDTVQGTASTRHRRWR